MFNKKLTSLILTITLGAALIVAPSHTTNAKILLNSVINKNLLTNEIFSSDKITKAQKDLLDSYNPTDTSTLNKPYAPSFSKFFKTEEAIIKTAKKHGISNYVFHSHYSATINTSYSTSDIKLSGADTVEHHEIRGVYSLTDKKANKFRQSAKDLFKVTMGLSDSQIKKLDDSLPDAINIYNNTVYSMINPIFFVKEYNFDGKKITFYVNESSYMEPNTLNYFYSYYKITPKVVGSVAKDVIPINKTIYNTYVDSIDEANKAQTSFIKNIPKGFKLDKELSLYLDETKDISKKSSFYKSASITITDSKTKKPIAKVVLIADITPIKEYNEYAATCLSTGSITYKICYIPLEKGKQIKAKELQYISELAVKLEPSLNKNTLNALKYGEYMKHGISAGFDLWAQIIPTDNGDAYKLTISKSYGKLEKN